jgi:hypothetical protein
VTFNPPGFATTGGATISTWPRVLVQIAWNAGGNTTAPNHWYTVSERLRGSWKATLAGRQYESDSIESGSLTFTLDNLDGQFDPDNTSSFFNGYVLPYRRCRLVFMANPTRNLAYPWMANGTNSQSQAASTGTLGTASGLSASQSGLTTAITWALPNAASTGAVYGPTGATQSWSTTDNNAVTVVAGRAYSAGVDLRLAAGGMSSLNVQVQVAFYSLTGSLLGGSATTTTALTTANRRMTVSGTAPAGAAFAIPVVVTEQATTAATTVQATAWQFEESSSATAYVTSGGWQQMWQGFVERWPQRYDKNGKYGLVDITAVDALAPLSQLTFANVMANYMKTQNTTYQMDLGAVGTAPDVANAKAFNDLNGNTVGLDLVGSAITTNVSISSTNQNGTLWNTPGPVITMANNQAASLGNTSGASYLQWATYAGKGVAFPASGGWTRMVCFRTSLVPGQNSTYGLSSLWCANSAGFATGSGDQSGAYLYINSNGNVGLNVQNSGGTNIVRINTYVTVTDGDWHCAIASLSSDGKTIHLTVDGTWFFGTSATSVFSNTYTTDAIGSYVTTAGLNTQPFNGDMAWVAQWQTELSVATQIDISNGFSNGWSGESNGNRLNRIMTQANFQPGGFARSQIIGSDAFLGGVTMNGRSPLDVLQESADTEVGQFAIDRNGVPTLYGQLWRWIQNSPRATFGENVSAGEIPYQADITFEQDPAHLFNDIQVTCDGSSDLTDANSLQESQDATSQANYFPQTLQKTTNPQVVQGGKNVADYLLSQFKDPHTRLAGLNVECASNPNALSALMTLNFADLVMVNRRPTSAPSKSLSCFIEKVTWSGDDTGKTLKAAFEMSPASQYQYGVISATWGKLTAGVSAGATVVTVGPLNGLSLEAAQYVIPGGAGYQMTLGYGTANAETVTVLSVQTVSPGYTSVQVTLASATTKSHSTNDYLCDINPGTIALPPGGTYPSCFDNSSLTGGYTPLIGL